MDFQDFLEVVGQPVEKEYKTVYSSKEKHEPLTDSELDIVPPTNTKYATVSHKDFISWMRFYSLNAQNMHWAALNTNIHVVLGDIYNFLNKFIDDIAEKLQGIYMPFCIADIPASMNKEMLSDDNLLCKEIISLCGEFKNSLPNEPTFYGVMSDLDACIGEMNKFIYLIKLAHNDSL